RPHAEALHARVAEGGARLPLQSVAARPEDRGADLERRKQALAPHAQMNGDRREETDQKRHASPPIATGLTWGRWFPSRSCATPSCSARRNTRRRGCRRTAEARRR